MSKEKANWDLEKLLQSRSFEELSTAQKQWVLQEMTETEYQDQRWMLLKAKDYFAADIPQAPAFAQILKKRQSRNGKQGFFAFIEKITAFQVPAWQLGMAIVCGWIIGNWSTGQENSAIGIVPQIVYQTDTIVREIPVYIGIGKEKFNALTEGTDQQIASTNQPAGNPNAHQVLFDSTNASIAQDRELLQFAVGMQ